MKNLLYIFTLSFLFIFCGNQATFANTEIKDNAGNTLIYNNASQLIGIKICPGKKNIPKDFAYDQRHLQIVVIPASVEVIEQDAFLHCISLREVKFASNSKLWGICNGAFESCFLLNSINLPNSLKYIGYKAFYNCGSLSMKIPDSVAKIEGDAFDCSNLNYDYYDINNPPMKFRPVQHIYYNGPASNYTDVRWAEDYNKPKELHKWGAARRN